MKFPGHSRLIGALLFAGAALACFASGAHAAEGITPKSITLVQTADLSGSRASLARELNAGTEAYFAEVNARGGVHGRKLVLQTEDDGYDVERTKRIVATRIERDDAFAFMSLIGTANAVAVLPMIDAAKVPLVAPLSGASQLRQGTQRQVFHIRASYAKEVEKMVEHAATLGITRVAVFYDDDAFGQDILKATEAALAARRLSPAARGKVERGSTNVSAAVKAIAEAQPQVVICGSFGKSLIEFVGQMNSTGQRPTYYALSFLTAGESVKRLGKDARGMVVTQVVPNPAAIAVPLVREFRALLSKHSPTQAATAISLEGFLSAKVIVEALRRAGPDLSRAKFVSALEALRAVDLGSLALSYSPTDHSGLGYVEITVIGERGNVIY